ncbi:MAG: hypothetical protein SCM11_07470, partial [Bacillota bacterium]|nr:hypothetical protein [Bacillota bacterium]
IYGSKNYANLAWPGDTTGDLLADLKTVSVKTQVRKASILTVNIGGNNLLGPSIAAICGLWGISPDQYVDDLDGRQMLSDLAAAIALKFELPDYDPMQDFMRLMDLNDPAAVAFHTALLQGTAGFMHDWPEIVSQIRQLNNRAELYVNTVHNPIQISNQSDLLYPLYLEFESLISTINLTIKSYALVYHYRVVDSHKAYKSIPGALTFDIAGAVAAATAIVSLDPADPAYAYNLMALQLKFLQKTDPHPSYIGHAATFELLQTIRSNTPAWYWR